MTSQAGTVQVVARSIETSLHKLFELGFDLARVESGWGFAPLPPVADSEIAGIGRTNDAILYGGCAVLWVRADNENAVRRYLHFGYAPDGLVDQVLANPLIK